MTLDYLRGQSVVVVGDGPTAMRRACTYRAAGAEVCVISRTGRWGFDPHKWHQHAVVLGLFEHILHSPTLAFSDDIEVLNGSQMTQSGRTLRAVDGSRNAAMSAHPAGSGLHWEPLISAVWLIEIATDDTELARIWSERASDSNRPVRVFTDGDVPDVCLVGGGPGPLNLLTIAGQTALEAADVVLVDRLGPGRQTPTLCPGALVIDVGKTPGHHKIPQSQIESLLVEFAAQGARVVRLKGGDPFVFGRGGEELLAAQKHGYSVATIPGITSAVAVPGAVGIPVTHRDSARAFTVISGHQPFTDQEFEGLVQLNGSIVVLMGVGNIPNISTGLLKHGMAAETPVSVIENGLSENQRELRSSLAALASLAVSENVRNPAVIVIGDVVDRSSAIAGSIGRRIEPLSTSPTATTLSQQTASGASVVPSIHPSPSLVSDAPNLQLAGFSIGVTADRRSEDQISAFTRRGADVLHAPTMRIVPTEDDERLHADTASILAAKPDFVLVTTAQGLKGWRSAIQECGDLSALDQVLSDSRILVRGPKAQGAVRGLGLQDQGIASEETTPSLIDLLLVQAKDVAVTLNRPLRVAVQLHGYADVTQLDRITSAGHQLLSVSPYRWSESPDPDAVKDLLNAIVGREVQVVTFTAAPAAEALLLAAQREGVYREVVEAFQADVIPAAVGSVTAVPLLDHGITPIYPERFRMGALIKQVCQTLTERFVVTGSALGELVELRRHCVLVSGARFDLSPEVADTLKGLLLSQQNSTPFFNNQSIDGDIELHLQSLSRILPESSLSAPNAPLELYK